MSGQESLGRTQLDKRADLRGKRVLITGGPGQVGSAIVDQLMRFCTPAGLIFGLSTVLSGP